MNGFNPFPHLVQDRIRCHWTLLRSWDGFARVIFWADPMFIQVTWRDGRLIPTIVFVHFAPPSWDVQYPPAWTDSGTAGVCSPLDLATVGIVDWIMKCTSVFPYIYQFPVTHVNLDSGIASLLLTVILLLASPHIHFLTNYYNVHLKSSAIIDDVVQRVSSSRGLHVDLIGVCCCSSSCCPSSHSCRDHSWRANSRRVHGHSMRKWKAAPRTQAYLPSSKQNRRPRLHPMYV
jgi:hypothetical protein